MDIDAGLVAVVSLYFWFFFFFLGSRLSQGQTYIDRETRQGEQIQ